MKPPFPVSFIIASIRVTQCLEKKGMTTPIVAARGTEPRPKYDIGYMLFKMKNVTTPYNMYKFSS